jgi:hypothetical protein
MKIIVLTLLIGVIVAMAHLGGPLAMASKAARAIKALKRDRNWYRPLASRD